MSVERYLVDIKYYAKWCLAIVLLSAVTGTAVALFLWLLDWVTIFHFNHQWLLYFLPLSGIAIYFAYHLLGKNAANGTSLVLARMEEDDTQMPARMAPLVLVTTLVTHLFGGSAGREGTAVQMGAGVIAFMAKWIKFSEADFKILLMAGMSAGFAAVFGTPITAMIFVVEIVAIRSLAFKAVIPCLLAAFLADFVCSAWGIHHTVYTISSALGSHFNLAHFSFDFMLFAKAALAGVAFGLVGWLFIFSSHGVKHFANHFITTKWMQPVVGGLLIIGLTLAIATRDYLGLGVSSSDPNAVTIVSSFTEGGASSFSWFWKLLFTVVTLSFGFKGGEVTPLFFIGAALGNSIAVLFGAPVDLMAGLGFIAVFAAATNAPMACAVMGIELFGVAHWPYYAVACLAAFWFSSSHSIYRTAGLEGWMKRVFSLPKSTQ
jgi:H+/Cl- antiporter ClcA